jgi:hypothetical protein
MRSFGPRRTGLVEEHDSSNGALNEATEANFRNSLL